MLVLHLVIVNDDPETISNVLRDIEYLAPECRYDSTIAILEQIESGLQES